MSQLKIFSRVLLTPVLQCIIMWRYANKGINQLMEQIPYRFYDIAANLTDEQFGSEKKKKEDDRDQVVERAAKVGCTHLLIAAGCVEDALHAYELCNKYNNSWLTIGVHPCRAIEAYQHPGGTKAYFQNLEDTLQKVKGKLVAIGQCGLDYDRLHYSSQQQQLEVFPLHFDLAQKYNLPMYLHNRNTGDTFYSIVKANRHKFSTGIVHSFTGTKEELQRIVELDLYIGINGCSLKTQENLDTLHHIPIERIMLETDSPYCEIRQSHASSSLVTTKFQAKNKITPGFLLKGRNQPCRIVEVLEVVSRHLNIDPMKIAEIAFRNSLKVFHGTTFDA